MPISEVELRRDAVLSGDVLHVQCEVYNICICVQRLVQQVRTMLESCAAAAVAAAVAAAGCV